ncbi:enoyl-CoA hydratase/isomerase family protein [Alicyclobacillus dauci]|uniref:Enoyl-CoA hydratase-related protein n=1 Tax=Alicyclobacillus dauci TaxID=1475485 RepID=A0ABY6Z050_9BACL|nr:enoyl-CoA hydratase-related protein [Alicyclobacillus dauci]WAH36212.1 enoyl-CoA hydratase-related protein [Alicyclobacillus dauci]
MSTQDEIYVERFGKVAVITLNRPEQRNAFTPSMIACWAEMLDELGKDKDVNVIVTTGKGPKAFCSGAELKGLEDTSNASALQRKNELWEHIHKVALAMDRIDKPTIAAVNGVAVGAGMDMALMNDLRFMSSSAKLSEGYVKIGLVPGDGGAYFLPRLVGTAKALELLWSGDFIDTQTALSIGLVNRVYDPENLMDETLEFASRLANGPSVAIRMIKRAVYQARQMDVKTALDLISSHFSIIRETNDHKEGIRAMIEKRRPNFQGN